MKALNFQFENNPIAVELDSAVNRDELYGRVSRVVQSPEAEPLCKGILTQDGALLPASAVMHAKIDAKGSLVGGSIFEREGQPVVPTLSSFKEARPLTAIKVEELATLAVESVYPIKAPDSLPPGYYSSTFNYRDALAPADAILVIKKDAPSFLLVGEKKTFAAVGQGSVTDLFNGTEGEPEAEDDGFGFDNL